MSNGGRVMTDEQWWLGGDKYYSAEQAAAAAEVCMTTTCQSEACMTTTCHGGVGRQLGTPSRAARDGADRHHPAATAEIHLALSDLQVGGWGGWVGGGAGACVASW